LPVAGTVQIALLFADLLAPVLRAVARGTMKCLVVFDTLTACPVVLLTALAKLVEGVLIDSDIESAADDLIPRPSAINWARPELVLVSRPGVVFDSVIELLDALAV
jgi:hypothetical protein